MFKFIVVFAFVASALAAPIDHDSYGGPIETLSRGSSEDAHAQIKSLYNDINAHGFDYSYETTNNIKVAAKGDEHGNIQGEFGWVDPKGEHIVIQYIADENGYRPTGNILPTPPPIPEAILKSLEYIRTHPAYDENKHRNGGH